MTTEDIRNSGPAEAYAIACCHTPYADWKVFIRHPAGWVLLNAAIDGTKRSAAGFVRRHFPDLPAGDLE